MNKEGKITLIAGIVLGIIIIALLISVATAGKKASTPRAVAECNDRIDNDGDGYTDLSDVGCDNKKDTDETNCGDGVCEGGETSQTCSTDCGVAQLCGNNITEGTEVCDGTSMNGETCQSQGFHGGTLACNNECGGFVTSGCYTDSCSDTDGGGNVWIQGTVSGYHNGNSYSYTDFCTGPMNLTLNEYSCSGNTTYNSIGISCDGFNKSSTCYNGACI